VLTQVRDHDDTLMCDWNQRYSVETVEMSSHQNKLTRRRITPEQAHLYTSDLLAGLNDGVHYFT
jgi:hypothetical protein